MSDQDEGLAPTMDGSVGGSAERDDDSLAAGATFGRYSIVRKIGVGGMGAVYEAEHLDLKKRVALKTIHREVAKSPEARARFLREGQVASRIRHPHVVDIADVGIQDGVPYLVMEYFEGHDLATRLERDGPFGVEALTDLMLPVLAAIGAAHDVNVIHRDLKPENIFLARSRQGGEVPKVLDFGISKLSDGKNTALTSTGSLLGTPSYMAPEQAKGSRDIDARCDQYALGVILYVCLTGRLPFEAENLYGLLLAIGSGPLTAPRETRPDIPVAFESIVLRAMARETADRYESVYALGRELLPFAGSQARMTWTQVFTQEHAADRPALGAPGDVAPARPRSSSTLGRSARELDSVRMDPRRRRFPALGVIGALVLIAGIGATWVATRSGAAPLTATPRIAPTRADLAPPVRSFQVDTTVSPASARFELDGADAGASSLRRERPRDGRRHRRASHGERARPIAGQAPAPGRAAVNGAPIVE